MTEAEQRNYICNVIDTAYELLHRPSSLQVALIDTYICPETRHKNANLRYAVSFERLPPCKVTLTGILLLAVLELSSNYIWLSVNMVDCHPHCQEGNIVLLLRRAGFDTEQLKLAEDFFVGRTDGIFITAYPIPSVRIIALLQNMNRNYGKVSREDEIRHFRSVSKEEKKERGFWG